MIKIAILDRQSLAPDFKLNLSGSEVAVRSYKNTSAAQVVANIGDSEIVILSKVTIGASTLEQCPNLKHIAVAATGFNIVDLAACERYGVSVSNIPSYAATTVAEHTLSCILTLRRQILDYRQQVIAGDWQKSEGFCLFGKPFSDLNGAIVGIIGLGEIGARTAELLRPFGVEVIYTSRTARDHWAQRVDLQTLLEKSDVISLHCSLNESTLNLIGETQLQLIKPGSILINTARGGLVDEVALLARIKAGQLSGIAFDVLLEEPPKAHSPLLEIADFNNVIITPHCSWTSTQALRQLETVVSKNIAAYLAGASLNTVTRRPQQPL